jgi:hypothetical protein
VPPGPLPIGFHLSDPLFHALGFGLQLLQILLQPGDMLFARGEVPPKGRAGTPAPALAATTAFAVVTSMPTVSTAALAAVAVMLAVSTVAALATVMGMRVLRVFAPVTLIATMAVLMLIMFSHMFHLLSSRLPLSLPSRRFCRASFGG